MKDQKELEYFDATKLEEWIADRNWSLAHKTMANSVRLSNLSHESKCGIQCSRRNNMLHLASQCNASLSIIQQVVRNIPMLICESNSMGHVPLQTVLIHRTSPCITKCLIKANNNAVNTIDGDGKTSLHLAIDAYEQIENRKFSSSRRFESLLEIVCLTCSLNCSLILKEDDNGMNVIEYAIEKEANCSIVNKLKKITIDYRRKQCIHSDDISNRHMKKSAIEKLKAGVFKQFASNSRKKANEIFNEIA